MRNRKNKTLQVVNRGLRIECYKKFDFCGFQRIWKRVEGCNGVDLWKKVLEKIMKVTVQNENNNKKTLPIKSSDR